MKTITLERLRKYIGTKITVIHRAVTNTYKYEGIMQEFDQHRLVIRIYEEKREEDGCWMSGLKHFNKSHIVKVITEDGEEFT